MFGGYVAKRLAISVAGAVSLGSYEAGVLYEFLDAVRQHNTHPATTEQERIIIDVLTGASAGGMTAIILAQKLLYCADEFRGPYDNPLYNTWVTRISLAGLQATQSDERALESIFSSNLIDTISKELLMQRYAAAIPPAALRHVAVEESIRVGVALTNLDGVAYGYSVTPGGKFVYLDYADRFTRKVNAVSCDRAAFWEAMRRAAVASGAFPFAFRAQNLSRSATGEPDDYAAENLEPWSQDPTTFTYADGGILQNQPLGIAKNLVDAIDGHKTQVQRFYLFVSPHAKDAAENRTISAGEANYLRVFQRLLQVVIGQSGFQDWIAARGVNERIALLDSRAEGLKDALLRGDLDVIAW